MRSLIFENKLIKGKKLYIYVLFRDLELGSNLFFLIKASLMKIMKDLNFYIALKYFIKTRRNKNRYSIQ